MSATLRYLIVYSIFGVGVLLVAQLVNKTVPDTYMDELFHIPQAQAYCKGVFGTWDPLLTTPPGLYLVSTFHSPLLGCTTSSLRLQNLLFLLLLPLLYSSLLLVIRHPLQYRPSTRGKLTPSRQRQANLERDEEAYEGLVVAMWPVAMFFAWLYYTDLGGLVCVLGSLRLGIGRRWGWSALASAASLWFRQTNILWVAFIAGTAVTRELHRCGADLYDPPLAKATLYDIPRSLWSLITSALETFPSLIPILASYVPVFGFALAFVKWNGGIVLGDKANHVPTIHVPQLYYFSAFAAVLLAPVILSPRAVSRALNDLVGTTKRLVLTCLTILVMDETIYLFTQAHPFLLADNRHYAFYIWRRIINVHPLSRYALAPGYLLVGRLLLNHLASSSTLPLLPTLFYLLATSLSLIPTPLIEPRYFILPYIILRLHLRTTQSRLRIELALYAGVNAVVLWLFLKRPFKWEGIDEWQRFMW